MRLLIWHVHGSWTTAFVQGPHTYLLPLMPGRGPDGRGRAQTWDWPAAAIEVPAGRLRDEQIDAVILQRPGEEELARQLTGRRPGRDLPAVYLEHDAPGGDVPLTRHPMADRDDLHLVHVTYFNELFWDSGGTEVSVIEHGVVDPGPNWTGELPRAAAVVNEPLRRGRYTGTDLLPFFAQAAPLDVFGMGVRELPGVLGEPGITAHEDLPQARMHAELARRRLYLHPFRWTSLGLSLIEAMHLG
ncbi:MAG TPA: glycosyltransferase family 1 protein, partial [Streptosporangiaceae bacterium]|nr:glycosyltransferase family 1 protein [Streptosporangiaceae bacterium]